MDERSFRSYHDAGGTARTLSAEGSSAAADAPHAELTAGYAPTGSALVFGNLEIRPDEIQALADGRRVGLTVREFQVLSVLVEREDRVVRRADIYSEVWGGEMKHRDRSVDVFVRKVRNKLAQAAPDWAYIHTHFGIGYRFAATRLAEQAATDAPPRVAAV